ncbi:helix-turn-helix domain-containing protein [Sphingomonas sp. CLY1604]|uniref:helix-turn-helix domain-containing protein n=1 Tax=Sphingomonas sp. CLY1604 TaxID=3457786 RepID=UPI003FD81AEC
MNDHNRTQRTLGSVEEGFVVDVQSFLQELMDARDMNRADLARAMGVSRGRITQIFSDDCTNLTIRFLARAVHALGDEPEIDSATTRRMREARQRSRRAELVEAADNVVPLWQDDSAQKDLASVACVHDDARLTAIMRGMRAAGGSR